MKKRLKIFCLVVALLILTSPAFVLAAPDPNFFYGGWIPFWKKLEGAVEVNNHLLFVDEISPFSYEVNPNGTLIDKMKIKQGFWPDWLLSVRNLNVKVIPSIALFKGAQMQKMLSNYKTRQNHIKQIAAMAKNPRFDGVDIDYENKNPETKIYFSAFIKELSFALHAQKKLLSCTVEPRTPWDSLGPDAAKNSYIKSSYATDYAVLNKYCDQVRIMAYDQGRVDVVLNKTKGQIQPYAPVADPEWVEKVLAEVLKSVSPQKVMLGIPTYGYEYNVTFKNGVYSYSRIRALNYPAAMNLAKNANAAPQRNSAGELSFVYQNSTPSLFQAAVSVAIGQPATGQTASGKLVWFTDASAIQDKINLAKKYNLRGVVFFKFDGGADPAFWDNIK